VNFKTLSISARIFLLTAAGLAVGLLLAGILLSNLYSKALTRNIDTIAEHQLDALIARVLAEDEASLQTLPSIDPRYTQPNSGWYWQIADQTGEIAGVSGSAFGVVIPSLTLPFDQNNARKGNQFDADENWLRIYERKIFLSEEQFYTITVTADWDEIASDVSTFRQQSIIVLLAIGAILAALCAFIARLSLGPLLRLSSAVEAIRTGRKDRIAQEFPSEIEPVKTEINALLDANDKILQRAKNQVGDLAHGLKTPIAVIRNEVGEGANVVTQQLERMQAIVSRYLDRAQLAARTAIRGRATPIEPAITKITSVMQKLNKDKQLISEIKLQKLDRFQGDPEDFDEIVGNILDNALKWANPKVTLNVVEHDRNMIKLVVEDDGPGIPDDKINSILKRGIRLDEQKPGSGLGLGIVAELVTVYGGTIELSRASLNGLRVEISLPALAK
jgi:signal transduction histidine kinase